MKNYEDVSDFEINKRVARALGVEWIAVAQDGLIIDGQSASVNYCNNPSDAWPIIIDNKISISHSIALYRADALVYDKRFDKGFKIFKQDSPLGDTSSRGALRAAMICFLKMNDGLES